jgi:putative ABC transport system permease protein
MLRHLLKLTWKRKSRNLMLSLEILLAFAIVFGIAAFGLRSLQLYRAPVGFDGATPGRSRCCWATARRQRFRPRSTTRCAAACSNCRKCARSASRPTTPYSMSTWTTSLKSPQTGADVTPTSRSQRRRGRGARPPAGAGRWFNHRGRRPGRGPAVLNRRMAAGDVPGPRGARPAVHRRSEGHARGPTAWSAWSTTSATRAADEPGELRHDALRSACRQVAPAHHPAARWRPAPRAPSRPALNRS